MGGDYTTKELAGIAVKDPPLMDPAHTWTDGRQRDKLTCTGCKATFVQHS